jgi:probable rRNA maturation factor
MSEADAAAAQEVDVLVESAQWEAAGLDPYALARAAVAAASAETGDGAEAHLAVVFADDELLRRLNLEFRGKDAPTNVLSFPAATPPVGSPAGDPKAHATESLGDVVLAFETIAREAQEHGLSLHARTLHMIVHGFLHLHGYDHETDDDAARMEAMERTALARLGLEDPYEDHSNA